MFCQKCGAPMQEGEALLSPAAYNGKTMLAILCPITHQIKGYPFEVEIPPGFKISGVVLADQAKSLDWKVRKAELVCRLPGDIVETALKRLNLLLK